MSRARDGSTGRRRRGLTDEDAALWDLASRGYEPLKRPKSRVHGAIDAAAGPPGGRPTYVPHGHPPAIGKTEPVPPRPRQPAPPAPHPQHTPPPLAEFDRRKARKLAAGREEIEARIDLHGMRQSQAHTALRAFLLTSYARGLRNVLVITGKGSPTRETDPVSFGFMDSRERGILKRNVPLWLAEAELRAIVVSYRDAAPSHGGAGALYIHLRSRHRLAGER
jgi:DNA-nicking Smr family endonuclease